jgi:hypothetical protein
MTKNLTYLLLVLLFLLSKTTGSAQTVQVELEPWDSLQKLSVPQQEKLYLHFDKPYYTTGQRMWFRAYLLDAVGLTKDTLNKAVYVELINSRDSLIYRQKLNTVDGIFSGSFKLNEMLPEGSYRVRGYTKHMRNMGEAFLYQHPFFIGNNLSSEVRTNPKFTFITPKVALAEIKFARKNKAMSFTEIQYKLHVPGKKSRLIDGETTLDGFFKLEYNPLKFKDKRPSLTVYYQDTINKYERTFLVPIKNEFDVQIFPEGGKIIHGATNCIAYKAIKTDGLSIEVEGTLYDQEDKKVSSFKSEHLGMGKFCFIAEIFKTYHIIFKSTGGETIRIDIPKGEKGTFALGGVVKYGRILINVKSEMNRMVRDSLTLLGHLNGTVFYKEFISGFTPAVVFNTKDIPNGIAHFVLLDKTGAPISERLAFVRAKNAAEVALDYTKAVHDKRNRVVCVIEAKDSKGDPIVDGSFSIAVTDANAVQLDAGNDNIMSNLLLTSDLKGYIERPGLYFDTANKNAEEDIDLLLMTQGWRRFNINEALQAKKIQERHTIENGYKLSGQIHAGNKNKPLKDIQVLVYAPTIQYFNTTKTDDVGGFSFDNLFFPDKTQFTIQARRKKELKENIFIQLKEQVFPDIEENIYPANAATAITDEYMNVSNDKYFNENGTRNIYAKRRGLISITPAKIIEETKNEQFSYSTEDFVLEGPLLEKRNKETFPFLLNSLPGLEQWNERTQPKTSGGDNSHEEIIVGPRYAIDGNLFSYNEVKKIKVKDLESLRVLQSTDSTVQSNPLDKTLIALSFKQTNPISSSVSKQNINTIMPLGYTDNVLFYEPKYEFFTDRANPIPDVRSTITFIPEVKTGINGKAIFTFFTADRLSPYNIVIEGISAQGEPCRTVDKKMLLYKDEMHLIEK